MLQCSRKNFAQMGIFYPFVPIIFLFFFFVNPTFMWKSDTKWGFTKS